MGFLNKKEHFGGFRGVPGSRTQGKTKVAHKVSSLRKSLVTFVAIVVSIAW
jgi:hypothetical protein